MIINLVKVLGGVAFILLAAVVLLKVYYQITSLNIRKDIK